MDIWESVVGQLLVYHCYTILSHARLCPKFMLLVWMWICMKMSRWAFIVLWECWVRSLGLCVLTWCIIQVRAWLRVTWVRPKFGSQLRF
jgi:hypothetical protein